MMNFSSQIMHYLHSLSPEATSRVLWLGAATTAAALIFTSNAVADASSGDKTSTSHKNATPITQGKSFSLGQKSTLLQGQEQPSNPTTTTKPMYSNVRQARRWTWSDLFGGRRPWREEFDQHVQALYDKKNNNCSTYKAMPDPAKVMIPSHAIAGALLKEHYIEAYRVYEKVYDEFDNKNNGDGNVDSTAAAEAEAAAPSSTDRTQTTLQRTAAAVASKDQSAQVVGLVRLGTQVDGHEGIVHGGILAMLMDDVLGYGFYSVGWPAAFTANLNINYRAPVPAETILRIECFLEKHERRKLYWRICVTDARKGDIVFADATCLFVIPKQIYEKVLQAEK